MGRKTWLPGKPLGTFITSTFGISHRHKPFTIIFASTIVRPSGDQAGPGPPGIMQSIFSSPARLPGFLLPCFPRSHAADLKMLCILFLLHNSAPFGKW
jgi:hypothetical protein